MKSDKKNEVTWTFWVMESNEKMKRGHLVDGEATIKREESLYYELPAALEL